MLSPRLAGRLLLWRVRWAAGGAGGQPATAARAQRAEVLLRHESGDADGACAALVVQTAVAVEAADDAARELADRAVAAAQTAAQVVQPLRVADRVLARWRRRGAAPERVAGWLALRARLHIAAGDVAAADADLLEAANLYLSLDCCGDGAHRRETPRVLGARADLLWRSGRQLEAVAAADACLPLLRTGDLSTSWRTDPLLLRLRRTAQWAFDIGREDIAAERWREAAGRLRRHADGDPAAQAVLADVLDRIGRVESRRGRRREAVTVVGESLALRRVLAGRLPAAHEGSLFWSLRQRADDYDALGMAGAAAADADDALALAVRMREARPDGPVDPLVDALRLRAVLSAGAGKVTLAVATLRELASLQERCGTETTHWLTAAAFLEADRRGAQALRQEWVAATGAPYPGYDGLPVPAGVLPVQATGEQAAERAKA